jgi:hypothetical protein
MLIEQRAETTELLNKMQKKKKKFDKIPIPFLIEAVSKLGLEGNFQKLINAAMFCWVQWLMPVNYLGDGDERFEASPGKKISETPFQPVSWEWFIVPVIPTMREDHRKTAVSVWWAKRPYLKHNQKQKGAKCQWLLPVILATQEAEIRRVPVQSQPWQIVHETLS